MHLLICILHLAKTSGGNSLDTQKPYSRGSRSGKQCGSTGCSFTDTCGKKESMFRNISGDLTWLQQPSIRSGTLYHWADKTLVCNRLEMKATTMNTNKKLKRSFTTAHFNSGAMGSAAGRGLGFSDSSSACIECHLSGRIPGRRGQSCP